MHQGCSIVMIRSLVESAFQTGCLSVASEGLIGQVLATKGYQSADLDALVILCNALDSGQIQREARGDVIQRLAESCQQSQVSISSSHKIRRQRSLRVTLVAR